MLNENKILYSLDDVAIQPATFSMIKHRYECNPFDEKDFLPIFTAPMPSVVNEDNFHKFLDSKIYPIIPRTTDYDKRIELLKHSQWVAFSLEEAKEFSLEEHRDYFTEIILSAENNTVKLLIDIANGNMTEVCDTVQRLKTFYFDKCVVMVGNVANPMTFNMLAATGANYIRVSVGSGAACSTATTTGIFYPLASLINECKKCKNQYGLSTKIVADGGVYKYRDAFKCLALGADYVMMGKRLCACEDSAGKTVTMNDGITPAKFYYGMASDYGMKLLGKDRQRHPEGIETYININGTISSFADEFKSYLQSAMSYCACYTLENFKNDVTVNIISQNASKRFTP